MAIFGKDIKSVIIFPSTNAGRIHITQVHAEGIIPGLFALFKKCIQAELRIYGKREIFTSRGPVIQGTLRNIDPIYTPLSPVFMGRVIGIFIRYYPGGLNAQSFNGFILRKQQGRHKTE